MKRQYGLAQDRPSPGNNNRGLRQPRFSDQARRASRLHLPASSRRADAVQALRGGCDLALSFDVGFEALGVTNVARNVGHDRRFHVVAPMPRLLVDRCMVGEVAIPLPVALPFRFAIGGPAREW